MKLAGKVALVTGAQQGIGAAIARALAGEGANVAVSWLDDRPGAEAVARDIAQVGRQAHLLKADVSKVAEIEAMVAETVTVLGPPDILVNNAGVYPRVPLLEMRESDWDYLMDINLKAGCFATIAVAKAPDRRRKEGRLDHQPVLAVDARRGARRALQREQGRRGLDDAGDGPRTGAARHPGQCDRAGDHRHRPSRATATPMPSWSRWPAPTSRWAASCSTPEQIARTAVFLASDDSDATTGQVLHVNGGFVHAVEVSKAAASSLVSMKACEAGGRTCGRRWNRRRRGP